MFGTSVKKPSASLKVQPPFEEVLLNFNPSTHVLTAKVYKDGNIVYQGPVSKKEVDF